LSQDYCVTKEKVKNMFTKIDKKLLIIAAVFIILILIGSFFVYKYLIAIDSDIKLNQESLEQQTPENQEAKKDDTQMEGIQAEVNNENVGTLTICSDRCGDGVCQKEDLICENNNLNCICQETYQDCPQDCLQ